jgi:putative methyltransferase (TIGR04325 family)
MNTALKRLIWNFVPPGLLWLMQRSVVYRGDYRTWRDAVAASEGYDAGQILEKVRESLLKVKKGDAVYERDSVLFNERQYSWPLLTALLWIASRNRNRLHLIDFGGSLGSSYFQNRHFLSHLSELSWNIVEQAKFVECGRRDFEDGILAFYSTVEECGTARPCDTILLSSVLPYIEQPHDFLYNILSIGFEYVIIDRTPLLLGSARDQLTVQTVPECIYRASYPAWFFERTGILRHFEKQYEKVAEFDALAGTIRVGTSLAFDKGFIFKRIASANGLMQDGTHP